jgi:hypothetical protein
LPSGLRAGQDSGPSCPGCRNSHGWRNTSVAQLTHSEVSHEPSRSEPFHRYARRRRQAAPGELQQLGFSIPDNELTTGIFGSRGWQVVLRFQRQHVANGLPLSSVVDEPTAGFISTAVGALPSTTFSVEGHRRREVFPTMNSAAVTWVPRKVNHRLWSRPGIRL